MVEPSIPLMVEFKDVSKGYAHKPLLDNTSFQLYAGGFFFLSGAIGTGKTTILKIIQQLEIPDKGQVLVDQKHLHSFLRLPEHGRKIGVVFQDHKLIKHRSVASNIALPLQILDFSRIQIKEKVKEIADFCKIETLLERPVFSLSGGEQQLVAVARAAVHKPKLLLVDEPTANLDAQSSGQVFDLLIDLNKIGATVLFATHDLQLIRKNPRNILWIKNQKVVEIMVGSLGAA